MDASTASANQVGKRPGDRGFWALIATQFQGAFNDNLFQYTIIYFLVALYAADEEATGTINSIAGIVFSLPFILFPGIFGALSDRYSKRVITIWAKYIEVLVMVLGIAGFFFRMPALLWVMLFMMATQSAFFSPSKYGILPEILPESRLSWGNGMLSLFTMISIIAGIGVAGPLFQALGPNTFLAGVLLATLSICGTACSYGITRVAPAQPAKRIPLNPYDDMWRYAKFFLQDRLLLTTLIGYTYFWFLGKFLQVNLFSYGKFTLGASESAVSVILAVLALGIGVGSVCAGYMSRGRIELGLVPFGLVGTAAASALLALSDLSLGTCYVLFVVMGFGGGFFSVPLAAMLQERSPVEAKGRVMALVNVMTFLGMAIASFLFGVLAKIGMNPRMIFLVAALMSASVGIILCLSLPTFFVRAILWLITNTFYRLRVVGGQNIPVKGGALLVANHVSFCDPIIIMASLDRPVRFLAYRGYYNVWWMKPVMNLFGVLPVAATDGPDSLARTLRQAGEAVAAGNIVCVFPEGGITRTGQMQTFQRGYQRIMRGVEAPIIPVHIDNVWGSIFSYSGGRFFKKRPSQIPRTITVSIASPMSPETSPFALRSVMQELESAAWRSRKRRPYLLNRVFLRVARRNLSLPAIADGRTGTLSYLKALVGSIILARKLRTLLDKQPMVGILVPPTVGAALTNIALQHMGRVPVNLNYTASAQNLAAAAKRCGMTHCITAKAFLERVPVEAPAKPVYLEDIMHSVKKSDRIVGLLLALLCPARLLERLLGAPWKRTREDLATVIFSSGSEGEPKGVMLTHHSVLANIDGMSQVVPYKRGDVMMGILPFFHSFGFTGTLWAPMACSLTSVFHPSPLETRAIAELIFKHKAKYMTTTPTFLQSFIRRCTADELRSLEFVICGAEKMPVRIREAYREKFGVAPYEGYGTTECSPVVSVNIPDFLIKEYNITLKGNKPGTVGRPIPGLSVRVVDVEDGRVLGQDEPGLLQIKGPSVMAGYLDMPEKTAAVLKEGWYTTGDIVTLDEDGFITITDRLARFSKIAGEMVPHGTVEEELHTLLGLTEQSLAVTGVPDPRRGERLVVVHTLTDEQIAQLMERIDQSSLPNLWRPRTDAFYRIDAIPVLGTGKMDIKAVRMLAEKLDCADE